jgi:class 3 adenylate cyclase/pimeloyl-ACP methyl ester carboxylesterase
MDPVPTQYIDRDGAAFAFQIVGDGPVDVVEYLEIPQHLDLAWSNPDLHHFLERGATYSRAVYFQRRGLGLSDQISYVPTLEQQADDVLSVMDAAGMAKATLVGVFSTCAALALVAAKAPERVQGLVFLDPLCGGSQSSGEVGGWSDSERARYFELLRHAYSNWGSGGIVDIWDPVQATPYNRRLMAMLERCSATPSVAYSHYEWLTQLDVQEVFRSVQVPARVLHMPTNPLPESQVQYAADLMPTATFHLLPATLPGSSLGEAMISTLDHVEEVATGTIHSADADRYLGTVLFTDVVSSTELLARVGDATYRKLRSDHERLVRLAVETLGGRVMTVSGDGTLSVFDGPTAAVRCAETICHEAEVAGIAVRAGIHTGELERDVSNVTGLTVHIGARVGAAAEPGQVLVSRTVRDLVAGSGLAFASTGVHDLKGVPGTWELFAVTDAGEQPENVAQEESMQTQMDKMVLQTARTAPAFVRAAVRLGDAIERRRARTS